MIHQYLFEILQISIGNRKELTSCPSDEEWAVLLDISKQQQVTGVMYVALLALPSHQQLKDLVLLMRWHKLAMKIELRNGELSSLAEKAVRIMQKEGFDCMLLKGQSLMPFYPESLRASRAAGDIDLWVRKQGMRLSSDNEVYRYVRRHSPQVKSGYIHIDFPVFKGTDMEVHIRPCYLANPWHNHRLQQWFEGLDISRLNDDLVARSAFNRVFLLVHLYKHFIHEGTTLRQLMDYYLVSKATDSIPIDVALLKRFGVKQFYCDILPVIEHIFEGKMMVKGRSDWLLHEIMSPIDKSWGCRLRRLISLIRYYPDEVVCVPFFSVYGRFKWER